MLHSKKFSLPVNNNRILFNCPECRTLTKANVAKFRGRKTIIRVRCYCRNLFSVKLNFPKIFEYIHDSVGEMINLTRGSIKSRISVKKVSSTNIDIHIQGKQLPRKGDKVKITYTDPLSKRTQLQKATVLRLFGKTVSCFKI